MFSYNSVLCIFTDFFFTLYTRNSGNTVYDLVTIFFCVSFFSTK